MSVSIAPRMSFEPAAGLTHAVETFVASCRVKLRSAGSASFAIGSASAFLVLATMLSFVPDAPQPGAAQAGGQLAWQLRGSIDAGSIGVGSAEPSLARARHPLAMTMN